jgi:hypothetical protein
MFSAFYTVKNYSPARDAQGRGFSLPTIQGGKIEMQYALFTR